MAFGIRIIQPIDTTPGVAVGVSIPFNGPTGFNSTYTTKDAIKSNLVNYFLTNQGDRYDNPTFGGNLRQYIFEQIQQNTFTNIEDDIQVKINTYFPSITVESVDISQQQISTDYNTIIVTMKYQITGTGLEDSLQIAFG